MILRSTNFQILNPKQYLNSKLQFQDFLNFEFTILNLAYRQTGLFSAWCLGFRIYHTERSI